LNLRGRKWRAARENYIMNELHKFYDSPNIVSAIKSRRMRWGRHVARMEQMRNVYNILTGNLIGRYNSEDLGVDGKIISEWILKK
jgi:hypothetical protein